MEIMIPLIIFTTFICISCALLFTQGVLNICGRGEKSQIIMLVASAIAMAIAGIGVFFHLEHWERIFNGFGHITSGITQELIGIVIMALVIVVFFIMAKRSETGIAPKWCGWLALIASVGMVIVMAHSYMMGSVPVWNNVAYVAFFLANMLAIGTFSGAIVSYIKQDEKSVSLCEKAILPSLGIYALIIAIYLIYNINLGSWAYAQVGYYFDPTIPDIAMTKPAETLTSLISGQNAFLFWGGVVVLGLIVPALLSILSLKRNDNTSMRTTSAGVSLLCLIIGGVCWRVLLYITAIPAFAIF